MRVIHLCVDARGLPQQRLPQRLQAAGKSCLRITTMEIILRITLAYPCAGYSSLCGCARTSSAASASAPAGSGKVLSQNHNHGNHIEDKYSICLCGLSISVWMRADFFSSVSASAPAGSRKVLSQNHNHGSHIEDQYSISLCGLFISVWMRADFFSSVSASAPAGSRHLLVKVTPDRDKHAATHCTAPSLRAVPVHVDHMPDTGRIHSQIGGQI